MKKIITMAAVLLLAACGKNGDGGGSPNYPHPNSGQKTETVQNCTITQWELSPQGEHIGHYECTHATILDSQGHVQTLTFSPACQITIGETPLNAPLDIVSNCPGFPQ